MKLLQNSKGEGNIYLPVSGVVVVIAIIFFLWYYNEHRNDVVIHPPHIEVH